MPGTMAIMYGDDVTLTIPPPFPYTLYDQTFTHVTLDSNGKVHFPGGNTDFLATCLPQTGATYSVYLYWDDLRIGDPVERPTAPGCASYPNNAWGGCGVYTSVSGIPPNRIFNIEWRAVSFLNPASPANFELRLYRGADTLRRHLRHDG